MMAQLSAKKVHSRPTAVLLSQALASLVVRQASTLKPASVEMLGLTLETVTPSLARQLGEDITGVAVTDIERTSEAYRDANIRPGMVITEVDREPVASVDEFEAAVAAVEEGESFLIRVRAGASSFLTALTK